MSLAWSSKPTTAWSFYAVVNWAKISCVGSFLCFERLLNVIYTPMKSLFKYFSGAELETAAQTVIPNIGYIVLCVQQGV